LSLGKSTKTAATRAALLPPICTKSFVGCSFSPDPTGGAYSAPPYELAVFRRPTSKRKERGGERRAGREIVICLRKKKSRRLCVGCGTNATPRNAPQRTAFSVMLTQ